MPIAKLSSTVAFVPVAERGDRPPPSPVGIGAVRPLEEGDIEAYKASFMDGGVRTLAQVSTVQELTELHRQIARLKLAGLTDIEVAHDTGVSESTVGRVKVSPAFKELMEKLRLERDAQAVALGARMVLTADKAIRKVDSALDSDEVDQHFALKAFEAVIDRVMPSAKGDRGNDPSTNVTIINQLADEGERVRVIDGTAADLQQELSQHSLAQEGDSGREVEEGSSQEIAVRNRENWPAV